MKFNVKLPGQESEDEPSTESESPSSADSLPEAPTAGPLKRVPRLRLPSRVETKPEVENEPVKAGQASEAEAVAEVPKQLTGGLDVDSFFEEFFDDDDETPEVLDYLEEEAYGDEDSDSFGAQWEDFLSDDNEEEGPIVPVEAEVSLVEVGLNPFLDEDETGANPFLEDEGEDERRFDGTLDEEPSQAPVQSSKKPHGEEPVYRDTPVTSPKVKKIQVPPKPELSSDDAEALQKRQDSEAAARARKRHRGKEGGTDDADAQAGLEQKISYEVSVNEEGRERVERKGITNKKRKPKAAPDKAAQTGEVEITDENGKAKWVARAEAGRISDGQLALFRNLHRASGSEAAEETMKELFSRAAAEADDEATARRRKKLANRAIFGEEALAAGSRKRFTEKDREVLRYIGMFKYANAKHIANVQAVKEDTMLRRLYSLGERGLVLKKDLYGAKPLWYLTEGGMICSGLEVPRVKESGITFSMLPHQFVVNHVAGNLWGAGVNVLGLEDFPDRFRRNEAGEAILGETLVSEYEVQSSFATAKAANHKADVYRPAIKGAMERDFRKWAAAGKDPEGSPEMALGNEYMWALFPPPALKLAYHVPDLVVKRARREDGKPRSIAVEVELANKPSAAYERTLNAYKYDSVIYGKVVWVVKSRGAARKIREAAERLDIWKDNRVGIVPIYTEDGVFKGKAVWTI